MTTETPSLRTSVVSRAAALWRQPMYRTSYLLTLNTASSSALGFAYWLVAARFYSPESVGRSAAAISSMAFIAGLAQLNLMNAALRFIPVAGRPLRLGRRLLLLSTVLVAVAATIYLLGAREWTPQLAELVGGAVERIWFVMATAATAGLVMLSSIFVAIGRAGWSLALTFAFVGSKLALVGVAASVAPRQGVWYSWTLAAVVVVLAGLVVVGLLGTSRLGFSRAEPARAEQSARDIAHYLAPDFGGAVAWIACTTLAPVLVLEVAGVTQSGVFGVTWQIALALFSVPAAIGQSVVAHGVTQIERIDERFRASLRHSLLILAPAVLVLVLATPFVLRVFGAWYAEHSAPTLRLLALAAVPNAVLALEVSRARVLLRMRLVVGSLVTLAVLVLGLSLLLLPRVGAEGAALAWLIAEVVVVGGIYLGRHLPRRLIRLRSSDGVVPEGWTFDGAPASRSDTAVVFVRSDRGPAVIKYSAGPAGRRQIDRETAVLRRLSNDDRLGSWRKVLPTVIDTDTDSLITTRFPGSPVSPSEVAMIDPDRVLAPLHSLGPIVRTADDDLVEVLIRQPAATVAGACRRRSDRQRTAAVAADLQLDLIGRRVRLGWSHGDFWPGNVLLDDSGTVTGVIDWAQARETDLLGIDLVHWHLTTADRPLPAEVVRRLRGVPLTPAEQLRLEALQPDLPSGRSLVLLAWLRHVADNLDKSPRYATNPLWMRKVVRTVLKEATR